MSLLTQKSAHRRLPPWLRFRLPSTQAYGETRSLLRALRLHTVCESARCPNHWECWGKGTATFMIGGDRCTRACGFCAVATGKPLPPDSFEPERVVDAARRLDLRHVVITSVARDDLPDGGAGHFRRTVEALRLGIPGVTVEVLTPDFNDQDAAIAEVLRAGPHIFNHNLETVRRLTPVVRHRATYDRSLSVLRKVKLLAGNSIHLKSGLMLGLGESEKEVLDALNDLRQAGCEIVTLGQYLQPTTKNLPVTEYIDPEVFESVGEAARQMGFLHVASGPMVRSSYRAAEFSVRGLAPDGLNTSPSTARQTEGSP